MYYNYNRSLVGCGNGGVVNRNGVKGIFIGVVRQVKRLEITSKMLAEVIQKDDFITKYNNKIYKIFIDKYK